MDVYELIKQAIHNKNQVIATYDGHRREMCPHVIGRKGGRWPTWLFRKSGRRQALFFQFAGGSNRGLSTNGEWRCINVDQLTDVSVRLGEWHTGERHSRPQTCIDVVDEVVTYFEEANKPRQTKAKSHSMATSHTKLQEVKYPLTEEQLERLCEAIYQSELDCYQFGDDYPWCQENLRIVEELEPYASAQQQKRIREAYEDGHNSAMWAEHGGDYYD